MVKEPGLLWGLRVGHFGVIAVGWREGLWTEVGEQGGCQRWRVERSPKVTNREKVMGVCGPAPWWPQPLSQLPRPQACGRCTRKVPNHRVRAALPRFLVHLAHSAGVWPSPWVPFSPCPVVWGLQAAEMRSPWVEVHDTWDSAPMMCSLPLQPSPVRSLPYPSAPGKESCLLGSAGLGSAGLGGRGTADDRGRTGKEEELQATPTLCPGRGIELELTGARLGPTQLCPRGRDQ